MLLWWPNITLYSMALTAVNYAHHKTEFKLTKDTPYLTLTGNLLGVFCEDFEENWPGYNGTALYYVYCGHTVFNNKYVQLCAVITWSNL